MILQPIVENAVNHGIFHKHEKGNISIEFNIIDETSFEVTITDDGIGRKKSLKLARQNRQNHLSKSTYILKERIALLNQSEKWKIKYSIQDLDKKNRVGTKVSLIFTHF
jgi:sensor histidine kinase YesM